MGFKKKKPAKLSKNTKALMGFLALAFLFLAGGLFFLKSLDERMLPQAIRVVEMTAKARINQAVNNSVSQAVNSHSLTSEDFYTITQNENGRLGTLSVNTVLVNSLCNEIALCASKELMNMEREQVQIPYGALTGIKTLANLGPLYTVYLMPAGEAVADYVTSFESVGINQVNFQIWLIINSKINIVNPLQQTEIAVERKIPLVNTVINSEIPQFYLSPAGQ